jgi:hypothetical protein
MRKPKIIWQGSQWVVTTFGVEARDGRYRIRKDRLGEEYWLDHMREKEWCEDDFAEALRIGREALLREKAK